MIIKGYLYTITGLHISHGKGGDGEAKNLTTTARTYVPDHAEGRMRPVPIVPGTTMRGKMRKIAGDIVRRRLVEQGVKLPREVVVALTNGSTSGRNRTDTLAPDFYQAQLNHPLMGLFGGGPAMAHGALCVHPLQIYCAENLDVGLVPDLQAKPMPGYQWIDQQTAYSHLSLLRDPDELDEQLVEDYQQSIDELIIASLDDDDKSRIRNIISYEFVRPGAYFHLHISTKKIPEHVAGFLVLTLLETLRNNSLGGIQRAGCGVDLFNLERAANTLTLDDELMFEWSAGNLEVRRGGKAERLLNAFTDWEQGGKAWTFEDTWKACGFEGLDLSTPVGASKKQKKAKGKGKEA